MNQKKVTRSKIIDAVDEFFAHERGEKTGMRFRTIKVPRVDVKEIRAKLAMSQADFAVRFGFSLSAVRHWEQNLREPEGPTRAYLMVIDRNPEAVMTALHASRAMVAAE